MSRFWAGAPWTHIGVEYNYQLHHLFLGLHPDIVELADRVALLKTPDKIKIVHYSGAQGAKPWARVLDPKLAELWPDRARDAEYCTRFAQDFAGYWRWVKRDPAWFEESEWSQDCAGMYIGPNGEIYRRPSGDAAGHAPVMLKVPEHASKGAMDFLNASLKEWFDTYVELDDHLQRLDVDVRKVLLASPAD